MATLDIESLLGAISTESPGGDNLEYDPDFLAMQLAAEGKTERQMGDTLVPAEEPDWPGCLEALLREPRCFI